ncbi:PepSY-associated TM helix domain-containing protein [Altericroceibacterium xinjiangense]|uniref:PepSY-associated TM helix domain-containing protein n=1 Tax=Altericroceibacterium xinjiangense TaxID=762261 RepID=UPI0013DF18EF|nr:PepSY-associated TM helix domain-containing protein [Altericroceibacterium xinjiangense]
MSAGVRQKNAWLHGWAGLLLGWLMFAIFVTGTIAFFRQEVTYWMQPELHDSDPGEPLEMARMAIDRLEHIAPDAREWQIELPSEREPQLSVSWEADGAEADSASSAFAADRARAEEAAAQANARGGRPRDPGVAVDPATGAIIHPRETAGGDFLYHFHYQLHFMSRGSGMLLVGLVTLAMFIAILSGIVTHKKIFKDFFTFRRRKGQRSWLDAHNAAAVFALPFHLMITFSGLLLIGGTLLPFSGQERNRERQGEMEQQAPTDLAAGSSLPLSKILHTAQREWSVPVGRLSFDRRANTVELSSQRNDSLFLRPGGGPGRNLTFDGTDGTLLEREDNLASDGIDRTNRAIRALHLGRFADWQLRWLYFVAGIGGTVMVATGLVLWSVKRAAKRRDALIPIGQRLAEILNIGAVAGLNLAIATYFWANRLVPAGTPNRAELEIRLFFIAWTVTYLHAAARKPQVAWVEQLMVGGGLFALLPILSFATGSLWLPSAVASGNWIVAGFDAVCLLTATVMFCAARFITRGSERDNVAQDFPIVDRSLVPAE